MCLTEEEAVAEFLHEPNALPPVRSGNLEMLQEEPGQRHYQEYHGKERLPANKESREYLNYS